MDSEGADGESAQLGDAPVKAPTERPSSSAYQSIKNVILNRRRSSSAPISGRSNGRCPNAIRFEVEATVPEGDEEDPTWSSGSNVVWRKSQIEQLLRRPSGEINPPETRPLWDSGELIPPLPGPEDDTQGYQTENLFEALHLSRSENIPFHPDFKPDVTQEPAAKQPKDERRHTLPSDATTKKDSRQKRKSRHVEEEDNSKKRESVVSGDSRIPLRMGDFYAPESLPPALREWVPLDDNLSSDAESTASTEDDSDLIVDKFGFKVVERPAERSLRTVQDRQVKLRKLGAWYKFKKECEKEIDPEKVTEETPLAILEWGNNEEKGKTFQSTFDGLVRTGIPIELRAEVWLEAAGSYLLLSKDDFKSYVDRSQLELSESVRLEIEHDVQRTLTRTNIFFYGAKGLGADRIREILCAYAVRNPDTGYCQGMHKIAAFLILVTPRPAPAFLLLSSVIERIMPHGYWTGDLLIPTADQQVLMTLLSRAAPDIFRHFKQLEVQIAPFTMRWFIALFADGFHNTSAEFTYRVWDILFCRQPPDGYLFLFAVAIAVLREHSRVLLEQESAADVHKVLDRGIGIKESRIRAVINDADKMTIPMKAVDDLREQALQWMLDESRFREMKARLKGEVTADSSSEVTDIEDGITQEEATRLDSKKNQKKGKQWLRVGFSGMFSQKEP
ncbi:TBC-domain-containing protein [Eremomyces bilateralis CBS 781.70]|uniref:TBC-domain-containing protein n=1 Tax=Eremomyces bilateralis CBS 781.70 TaxID=1392243 RepID=A0A6G1GF88_9PEZI|nr:TBC-domain-containing protein [Eremomyces bilateralis CBS 781.70]KAF1816775.1 TBC-domain-containing protein [Eremomyces bilateralis CBS 781.70]